MRKKSLGIKKRLEKVMRIKADVWGCICSQRMRWERRIPSAVSRRLGASVKRTRAALNVKKRNSFFHPSQSNVKEKHLRKNPSARGAPKSSRLCTLVRVLARDRLRSCWTARTSLSNPSVEPSSSLWHGSSFFLLPPWRSGPSRRRGQSSVCLHRPPASRYCE